MVLVTSHFCTLRGSPFLFRVLFRSPTVKVDLEGK
jgi:hypothetical protein